MFNDNVNMKEFYEMEENQKKYLEDWEKERIIRKCHCGKAYSFENGGIDSGECASCRGQEGELIY